MELRIIRVSVSRFVFASRTAGEKVKIIVFHAITERLRNALGCQIFTALALAAAKKN